MQLCIVGGGFVGTTSATVFAEWGHAVTLVEVDPRRREALQDGQLPFYEAGLQAAWSAAGVTVVGSLAEASRPELVFLCVGTPSRSDGGADLRHLREACEQIAAQDWDATVVVKSTVPPGTTRDVVTLLVGRAAMNPEFLREGCALEDGRSPDRVVLGVQDAVSEERLRELFSGVTCPIVVTDPTTAEMVKYSANAMLATRIAFTNEIGNLCQRTGVDVDEVMHAVGLDFRIGPHFLKAGVGFGGSCFPKDVAALRATAAGLGVEMPILESVLANNEEQPMRAVELLTDALGGLSGKKVALLGLAFKPDTSDVRETRALPIYRALVDAGAHVVCHDPKANDEFAGLVDGVKTVSSSGEALSGVAACVVQTEWPEYREIPAEAFPAVVVDGRRHLDRDALEAAGKRYFGVGDGRRGRAREVVR